VSSANRTADGCRECDRITIRHHPLWPELRLYFRLEIYDRDGGHKHPRYRIEVRDLPPELAGIAIGIYADCVACGRMIHPIRERKGAGMYYAPTCPLDVDVGCARGKAARAEYVTMREDLDAR